MLVRRTLIALVTVGLVLGACGGGDDDAKGGPTSSGADVKAAAPGEGRGAVTIQTADASFDVTEALATAFEEENKNAKVEIEKKDSAALIKVASTKDRPNLLVVADQWLEEMRREGDVESAAFGENRFVIITPTGNPAGIKDLGAFAESPDRKTAACGPDSEFGNFAQLVFNKAGVTPAPGSVGVDCEAEVIQKVVSGELDAALMYRSAVGDANVDVKNIAEADNIVITISSVTLEPTPASQAFAAFIESDAGKEIRTQQGYLAPE